MKSGRIILVGSTIILTCMFLRNSTAQTIRDAGGLDRGSFSVKDDMRSYEVIYKEHGKVYEDYYREVREKVVRELKAVYRDYYRDGDVDLYFVVRSNGSLKRIDVDIDKSTKDKRLINIAVLSLQQASPFSHFPKELDGPQLPFSLTVSFKEKS